MPCATEPVLRRRDPKLGTAWDKMWPRAPTEGATTLRTAAPDRKGKASQAGRYLAGALEVGGVGLDELVRVDILHRPRRRSRHPAAAAAPTGDERETGDAKWWPLRLLGARVLSGAEWVAERKYIGDGFGFGASDGYRTVTTA